MLDQPMEDITEGGKELSFLDHLEILRWHIIRSLIAIFSGAILAFVGRSVVVDLILGPSQLDFWTYRQLCRLSDVVNSDALCIQALNFELINRKMMGQFTQHITVSVMAGFIIAFPYLLFEVWRFLKPALKKSERRYLRGVVFSGSTLFFLGVLCGYYLLSPVSVQFLANYQFIETLENTIDLQSYISLIAMITLAAAIVFQLPIVVYFLAKTGLVTAAGMRQHRKHALLVILVLSAVITPPDIMSQLLLTIPFFVLYESSIFIARSVERTRAKKGLE